jgi:sugar O-acyltransferase (sialic acid O-acetyltransferase NeuD family)
MIRVEATRPVAIFGGRSGGVLAAFALARAVAPHPSPLVGFLNDVETPGSFIEGTVVIGPFAYWSSLNSITHFLAPLHKPKVMGKRARLIRALGVPDNRWTNVIDPAAIVAEGTLIGSGIWAQSGSMVMPGARINSHVALRSGCQVSHDCVVEDFAFLGLGAILCGYSIVRQGAYLAPGAIVRDGVTVGCYSVVGLGAVVVKNVPDGAIVLGNPARIVGTVEDRGD